MGGGLLQLVAYGAQDAYLSGNPQITFWKGLYKRHTNFAMEPFRINFNGQANWGTKQTAIMTRHADLLYSTYLEVQLPAQFADGTDIRWNNGVDTTFNPAGTFGNDLQGAALGLNLLEFVELDVGGQIIDRKYSEFLYLWDQLTLSTMMQQIKYNRMLNGLHNVTNNTFPLPVGCQTGNGRPSLPNTLYIPLGFFFSRNPGAALPLIALQYHEVKINVQWNDKTFVAGSLEQMRTRGLPAPTAAAIYTDYIYLDTEERRRFAQQSHEYLIEQVQYNQDVGISSPNQRIDLTFNHPVKELIWVVQPSCYRDCKLPPKESQTFFVTGTGANIKTDRLLPFEYGLNGNVNRGKAAVYEQWLQINGQDRMDKRYGDYFNKVQPYQHHTGKFITGGSYMYSFAIRPEENQPSGTCNFSRIDTATIVMTMDGSVVVEQASSDTFDVRVYAVNYNVFRVMSGMGGLAYSN
jgi:hypothetical protein